jgi:hypothetical protein
MGRRILAATAAHVAGTEPPRLGTEPRWSTRSTDAATTTPARRQPPPPLTLLPSDEELMGVNEAGDPTAFRALTPAQRFEFDVRGYIVLRGHYSPAQVAEFNAGIDEVQALPKTHANFTELGPLWAMPQDPAAMDDSTHEYWNGRTVAEDAAERKGSSMSVLLAGSDKFDAIVRDPLMREIHRELAGGTCMLSGNYYIEKFGPCPGGALHHGGFPRMRTFHYAYDLTNSKFACFSTKATVILSDMTTIEKGPFAVIVGSHKANMDPRTHMDLSDASKNDLGIPACTSLSLALCVCVRVRMSDDSIGNGACS